MSALSKSIYLAWRKSKLTKEISFKAEFTQAKHLLIRLAEKPPYTLSSLYSLASIKRNKKSRKITVLIPPDAKMLVDAFPNLFEKVIEVESTPFYGAASFKSLKENLASSKYEVFIDFDLTPLPELAVLSKARLRMAYFQKDLYPYFNILFRASQTADILTRASLMTRSLIGDAEPVNSLSRPQIIKRDAGEWLKLKGIKRGKNYPLLVSSIPFQLNLLDNWYILNPEKWESETNKIKASLIAEASAYLGSLDRGFEIAYLLGTPIIALLNSEEQKALLPAPNITPIVPLIKHSQDSLGQESLREALSAIAP